MPQEKAKNLRDLLVMKLQTLYYGEQQFDKGLTKMIEAASDEDLKAILQSHLEETKDQSQRLVEAFDELDAKAEPLESDAIDGLVSDAQWCIDNIKNPQVLDASLIAAAQYVEHHEIAGYGSAATWAEQLEEFEVKEILGEILDEEKAADEKLSGLALAKINEEAADDEVDEVIVEERFIGRLDPGTV
jgi:ferritin-like metal-binding protein YciE